MSVQNLLGIAGLFSRSSAPVQIRKSTGINRSIVNPWFKSMAPQYLVCNNARIQLDGQIYTSLRLMRIAGSTGRSRLVNIAPNSKLLDFDETTAIQDRCKRIQSIGASLAKELITSLDTLALFRHPEFDQKLLTLGILAITPVANDLLRKMHEEDLKSSEDIQRQVVDDGQIRYMFHVGYEVPHTLLGYLKCIREDNENHLQQFRSALQSQTAIALNSKCVDALVDALQKIKHRLATGTQIGSNPGDVLDTLATEDNHGWLKECRDEHSQAIHALVPSDGKFSFQSLYRKFLSANEEMQRIVRTDIAMPYMVTYLFSKYREHSQSGLLELADTLYKVGVASQPAPRPRISMEMRHRFRGIIKAVMERAPDVVLQGDKNLLILRQFVEQSLSRIPEFDSVVTQDSLVQWHRTLTIESLSLAGGATGELLASLESHNKTYKPLLQKLMAVRPTTDSTLYEKSKFDLLTIAVSEQKDFVRRMFDRIPEDVAQLETIQDAFVHTMAEDVDHMLQEGFVLQQNAIRAEANLNDALTLVNLHIAVCSIHDTCGASHALTPEMLDDVFPADEQTTRLRLQVWEEAAKKKLGSKLPQKLTAPIPTTLDALPSGKDLRLIYQSQRHVGTLRREDETLIIEPCSPDSAAYIASEDTFIEIDGQAFLHGGQPVSLVLANVRGLQSLDPFQLQQSSISDLMQHYDRLADQRRTIINRIASNDRSDVANQLRSYMRVITLIESALACPAPSIALGTADLSQALGLTIAMAATVDANDPDLFVNKPSARTTQRLVKLDLSNFLSADNVLDMAREIGFYYDLCQTVDPIRDYLREIREQSEFARYAPLGLNTLYINQTLNGHNQDPTTENLFFSEHQPLVVYLTRQAFENIENAPIEFNNWITRLLTAVGKFPVRIPIFVSAITISNSETAVPVIDPRTNNLPKMMAGKRGRNAVQDAIIADRVLQPQPYLPLAASLFTATGDFGSIATSTRKQPLTSPGNPEDTQRVYADIPDELKITVWPESLGVTPQNEDLVSRLLHDAWFAPANPQRSGCHLLSELVTTVVLNLAIAEAFETKKSLVQSFGRLLKDPISKPGRLAKETAGLPPCVAQLVRSLQVKRQNAWGQIPTEGASTTLLNEYRAQLDGLHVSLSPWMRKLHERLMSISAPAETAAEEIAL